MSKRKAFVQVPHNNPAGGVKVANQLVNLLIQKGWQAYLVVPQNVVRAQWMIHPAPVINLAQMKKLCLKEDIVIDNWPDRHTLAPVLRLPSRLKIFYCQGCSFPKSKDLIGDYFLKRDLGYDQFWAVSQDTLTYLQNHYPDIRKESWHLVHPYFDQEQTQRVRKKIEGPKRQILCLGRKGRKYIHRAGLVFGRRIRFLIQEKNLTEKELYRLCGQSTFFLSTAIGIDNHHFVRGIKKALATLVGKDYTPTNFIIPRGHREGFPLPPAEAALCGSVVIGFAMGGGLEWMNQENSFLAKDRSLVSLLYNLREALKADPRELLRKRRKALHSLQQFNQEHTWQQVRKALDLN